MWHLWGRRKMHTWLQWGNFNGTYHLAYAGTDGKIIIK
jgi:hypothetical protein